MPFDRRQRRNGELYLRGLIEHGARKSLQPTLFRLRRVGGAVRVVQQFLADSPWWPANPDAACAERVAARLGVTVGG